MPVGAITSNIDVAQVTLYAFWIFFAGLILYLRQEDRREGYPLQDDLKPRRPPANSTSLGIPGGPITPVGNPLLAGVGPGAWAQRADAPDLTFHEKLPKIVPLRVASGFYLEPDDPDPRGFTVIGGDDRVAGAVVDVWVDRSETLIRYYELEVSGGAKRVLAPATFAVVKRNKRQIKINAIFASQFADAPTTKNPVEITLAEEDQIAAYYGAGTLYASPGRLGPYI
ncbi:photosynthetic reaction center subunit H [Methylocapsa palsarum]|uniref:Photosynthetic reaction center H subunit n=1 Tax=Methylocapsa palsarum TaxID=1612308 RepID=A0A1I3XZ40_9HYPH|nr:photosynthetic reaction center subunit H [Methylocapsa palsarum]SFK24838.1 photosynthetic reaction center H subunit [Methylocapsa palsarum]